MIYFDTSYLAKLYLDEPGARQVLTLVAESGEQLCCAEHGRLELITTFKRKERERALSRAQVRLLWKKHDQDIADELVRYFPLPAELIRSACERAIALPPSVFLRAADALHLACAADAKLKAIYSHDRHLLAAAPHFGLKGIDILSP